MGDGLTLGQFFELWELFRDAALTGAFAGGLLGLLGVYVVLRRMVFLSAAVSQAAGLGVALSFYAKAHLGLVGILASPTLGAAALTLLAVALIVRGGRDAPARRDGLLGVVWLLGAAGTLAVGTRIVQDLADIDALLFGTAVAVVPEDVTLVAWTAIIIGGLHLWGHRGFSAVSFDPDGARVRGLPARALDWTLFATLAVAVSVCTRVVGALPTFAFSVLPALAAVRLASNVPRALVLATALGIVCGFGGYLLASLYDLPVGAAQTLLGLAVAAAAAPIAWVLDRR